MMHTLYIYNGNYIHAYIACCREVGGYIAFMTIKSIHNCLNTDDNA